MQAFRADQLPRTHTEPPQVATVSVDGGRVQTRTDDGRRGVREPGWREAKVACCQTLSSGVHAVDPQPEPPAKFLDPVRVARLAAEMKTGGGSAKPRAAGTATRPPRRRKARRKKRPQKLVRSVIASMCDSEAFGWQVAAEVHRRGLDRAKRKGYICDGQKYNWTLHEMHLVGSGFVGILDFLHLLAYLYASAQAVEGRGSARAFALYERWLRWAWSGCVKELLASMHAGCAKVGPAPEGCGEEDPRKVAAEALGYVENNRGRMNYPEYRRQGLPVSSAPVESVMKQVNRRMKGTEKFWLEGGAEAMLQIRASHLSEDGRVDRYWSRPRPHGPAAGTGRLRPAA